MYSQDLGGCISTLDMGGIPVKKPKKLYHIITDSKFLELMEPFLDYNGGLKLFYGEMKLLILTIKILS